MSQSLISQREALQRQLAELDQQIEQEEAAERKADIEHVRSLITKHGLTAEDLGMRLPLRKAKSSAATTSRTPSPLKGRKLPVKFRDPVTGKVWTGRGVKPTWLVDGLSRGKSMADYAV